MRGEAFRSLLGAPDVGRDEPGLSLSLAFSLSLSFIVWEGGTSRVLLRQERKEVENRTGHSMVGGIGSRAQGTEGAG